MVNLSVIAPKDGDGDGEDIESVDNIIITAVNNGWVLHVADDTEGVEYQEVYAFKDYKLLVNELTELLGVPINEKK